MLSTMMLAYPKNVTINADSRPAEKVFAEIVVQSGHNYIYSPDLLKGLKVTVHAKNEPLESVLKRMFSGTGIAFTIKGNNVVLKKEKKAKGKESEARRHSVSGFVKEEESGEPIAGAIVRDRRTGKATITNANGFYTLSLPQGETTLQASSFDYIDSEPSEIHLFADKSHDFSLGRSRQLEEVVITASNEERHALHSSDVGSSTLSIGKINAIPAVFGERDVIKSLQLDPGVSAGVEGLAGMYVHGGNADENLYIRQHPTLSSEPSRWTFLNVQSRRAAQRGFLQIVVSGKIRWKNLIFYRCAYQGRTHRPPSRGILSGTDFRQFKCRRPDRERREDIIFFRHT